MAKPKKKTKSPAKKKTPSPAPTAARDTSYATAIATLSAKRAPLSAAERSAFASLFPDEACDALGVKTRAHDVRKEAIRWGTVMDGALGSYPGALAGYSPRRFQWFLACATELDLRIEQASGQRGKHGAVTTSAEAARAQAMAARTALAGRLRTYAGGRTKEREALAAAFGTADTDDNLMTSLRDLVALADRWLGTKDAAEKLLLENAGLGAELVAQTRAALDTFRTTAVERTLEGAGRTTDTPTVNRAEGRMLLEMREARRLFHAAREENRVIPSLNPSPSVRHGFGVKSGKGGMEEPDDDENVATPEKAPAPAEG